jgi:thiamine biosynthesis lipoprotein ApbE
MRRSRRTPFRLRASAFVAGLALAVAGEAAESVRRTATAFDEPVEVELAGLGLVEARAAADAAVAAIAAAERRVRELETRLTASAAEAGAPAGLDAETLELMVRADAFCRWSDGVVSALGGRLLRVWGVRFPAPGKPTPEVRARAAESARCDRLSLDRKAATARVAAGTEADLLPFELGWALDRGAAALAERGVENFRLRLGPVLRGAGAGPRGRGWKVEFPALPGATRPLDAFFLRDRSAAILTAQERPLWFGGDPAPRWVDLARGEPAEGRVAVAVVTELAVDAQALAWAMFARGPRDGQFALGALRPEPSVLWALGRGEGEPLLVDSRWSAVPKR